MNDARETNEAKELRQELAVRDALLLERNALLTHRETQLAEARQEIFFLKKKLDQLARKFFGKKSEQLDPQQLQLLFQELAAPGPAEGKEFGPQALEVQLARPPRAPRPRRTRTLSLPEHLPVVEEIIEPPQVQACPEAWRRIGEEISERLDYEPARFFRRRIIRPKYVSRAQSELAPILAELAPCLLERSLVTPAVLALILVGKYCDHLPLYRQETIYWRQHQVLLSRQLMALWVGMAADWLRLIYEHVRQEVLAGGYVQIDETPIRYLEPGHGQTKLGYLWTCHQPGGDTVYHWATSRAAECLQKIVPVDFGGYIQCDGYRAYDAFARERGEAIKLAGCWAHVRRPFHDAIEEAPRSAGLILHLLQNLYRTEKRLRETKASPKLRVLARQFESRPVIARVHRTLLCWQAKHKFLPQSLMGRAITYALGEWESLLVYLRDGRVEIDNNLVENAIRPTAIGKKNWLFFGEAQAGERSAIIYTIIEACRRRGLDPFAYLKDTFTRLPTATNWQIADLTPAAWAKANAARVKPRTAAA